MEWISTGKELPEKDGIYVVLLDSRILQVANFSCAYHKEISEHTYAIIEGFWNVPKEWKDVTHWINLPEPPDLIN